jgi:hypothetical protein
MSRSFKKVPIIKYGGYGKLGKHFANKRVRKNDIGDNGNYKKLYERYDIYDIKDNLYRRHKYMGIPCRWWSNRKMTIDEIMEYWRK